MKQDNTRREEKSQNPCRRPKKKVTVKDDDLSTSEYDDIFQIASSPLRMVNENKLKPTHPAPNSYYCIKPKGNENSKSISVEAKHPLKENAARLKHKNKVRPERPSATDHKCKKNATKGKFIKIAFRQGVSNPAAKILQKLRKIAPIAARIKKNGIDDHKKKVSICDHKKKVNICDHKKKVSICDHKKKISIGGLKKKVSIGAQKKKVSIGSQKKKVSISDHKKKVGINDRKTKVGINDRKKKVGSTGTNRTTSDAKKEPKKLDPKTLGDKPIGVLTCNKEKWVLTLDFSNMAVRQVKVFIADRKVEVRGLYRANKKMWRNINENYIIPECYPCVVHNTKNGIWTIVARDCKGKCAWHRPEWSFSDGFKWPWEGCKTWPFETPK
uniref:Uncharacterized protein n=1 Tax=Strigamia maritima TaxID=126957 RepID=T1IWE6_STRMM